MDHCIPLERLSRTDLAVAGGKGANLGELLRAGYAVPPGFVVTTGAYRSAPDADERSVPEDVARAVEEAYAALGSPPVAVRSSATAEDLPGAAFAGQQDTFLNVVGAPAVVEAVGACWASLRSERAVAYRRRLGIAEDEVAMAVVVQEMAEADWAGVMFTANPVSGARDQVVIDASPGLGESVVGGTVTPAHAVVGVDGTVLERATGAVESVVVPVAGGGTQVVAAEEGVERELPDRLLAELARVGRSVQEHMGTPQDIEWVVHGGRVLLTQARPMTALPPAPVRLNRLQRVTGPVLLELLPRRPLPLELTAWTDEVVDRHLGRMFGGIAGMRLDRARLLPRQDGVLSSFVPPVPRPSRHTPVRLLRSVARGVLRRAGGWRSDPLTAELRLRTEAMNALDPGTESWERLQAVQPEVAAILGDLGELRARYLPAAARSLLVLALALLLTGRRRHLGDLLVGAGSETLRANAALAEVAAVVRADPALRDLFGALEGEELAGAVATRPEAELLRERLTVFLDRYGHREGSTILLLRDPAWVDAPAVVLGLVRALVEERAGPPGRRGPARVDRDRLPPPLRRLAAAAAEGVAVREDTHFEISRPMPVLRRVLLELGRRLAAHGWLERPEDVWWLLREELAALPDPAAPVGSAAGRRPGAGLREIVDRRRDAYAALAGSPLIAPASLYPAPAAVTDALVVGVPGGGGRATGAVRVVPGPEAFGTLQAGEVLVCAATSPPWTPLFARAAAVVVDHGGPASHAAIVAREYGLPVVLATGTGTAVLRTGQAVTVDGTHGTVVSA